MIQNGYLIRNKKLKRQEKPTYHLWTGNDTACRMWSTGGLANKHKYELFETLDHPEDFHLCTMCNPIKRQEQSNRVNVRKHMSAKSIAASSRNLNEIFRRMADGF